MLELPGEIFASDPLERSSELRVFPSSLLDGEDRQVQHATTLRSNGLQLTHTAVEHRTRSNDRPCSKGPQRSVAHSAFDAFREWHGKLLNWLTRANDNVPGAKVGPVPQPHELEELPRVEGKERHIVQLRLIRRELYGAPLKPQSPNMISVDRHECGRPDYWLPQHLLLKIEIRHSYQRSKDR